MGSRLRIEVRLDAMLKARGRSRYWLAQHTGLSEEGLKRIARQLTGGIKYETLAVICDALDCEPGDILLRVREANRNG